MNFSFTDEVVEVVAFTIDKSEFDDALETVDLGSEREQFWIRFFALILAGRQKGS